MIKQIEYSSELRTDDYLRLNCCGEQCIKAYDVTTLREHGRIDFSVQYIKHGKGLVIGQNSAKVAEQGSVIMYFPEMRQHYSFDKNDASQLMWMHFSGTACSIFDFLKSDEAVVIKIDNTVDYESFFKKMNIAKHLDEPYRDEICSGYLQVLMALIAKSASGGKRTVNPAGREGIDAVLNLMHQNFSKEIDLDTYAKMCFVSRNRFIHMFKDYTGTSPYHYQLHIRINLAIEMLCNTSVSVSECANAMGFRDVSYFCRIFKKYTSHTPMYYKTNRTK